MPDTDPAVPAPEPLADPSPGADAPQPRGLIDRLGIELLEVAPERAVGTMPVAGNTQPYGLLHGGATAALAETLGSLAAAEHAGERRRAVGVELSISHHRSATAGTVTGTATALHRGRTTATYEIVVVDSDGRRLSTARLTCVLVDATS